MNKYLINMAREKCLRYYEKERIPNISGLTKSQRSHYMIKENPDRTLDNR